MLHNKKKICIIVCCAAIVIISVVFIFQYINQGNFEEVLIRLDDRYSNLMSEEEFNDKGHCDILTDYDTESTICFRNIDGSKTLYVYAAPIRYFDNSKQQYYFYDTRLNNVNDFNMRNQGYYYTVSSSDTKPFYPGYLTENQGVKVQKDNFTYDFGLQGINKIPAIYKETENFIGEPIKSIKYNSSQFIGADVIFYPSASGTNCELLFTKSNVKSVCFWLRVDENVKIKKENGGYIVLYQEVPNENKDMEEQILGIVQKPILKTKNGTVSDLNCINLVDCGDSTYQLTFEFNENIIDVGSRAYISFETRSEKQPDNALYSNMPKLTNAYLSNTNTVGVSDTYGIGRVLVRFKFAKYFELKSEDIVKANYYIYDLEKDSKSLITASSVLSDWCSVTGNWSKNYKIGSKISDGENVNGVLKFDITQEVKKWCKDKFGLSEHNGIALKCDNETKDGGCDLLLSNDNFLFKTRTEIVLR